MMNLKMMEALEMQFSRKREQQDGCSATLAFQLAALNECKGERQRWKRRLKKLEALLSV